LRDHVYKIKNMSIDIDSDYAEATIARLMATLLSVVAVPLPKEAPPPPVPYSKRPAHPPGPDPCGGSVRVEAPRSHQLGACRTRSQHGRRRLQGPAPPSGHSGAAAAATPKSAGKRPWQPTRPQEALVGMAFEEGGADSMALPRSGALT
jgi:hypothetical protein